MTISQSLRNCKFASAGVAYVFLARALLGKCLRMARAALWCSESAFHNLDTNRKACVDSTGRKSMMRPTSTPLRHWKGSRGFWFREPTVAEGGAACSGFCRFTVLLWVARPLGLAFAPLSVLLSPQAGTGVLLRWSWAVSVSSLLSGYQP